MTIGRLDERVDRLASAFRWMLAVLAILLVGVFYESYEGRSSVVRSTQRGCERSKNRDGWAALGWRTAQHRAISQGQPGFAKTYGHIADGMDRYARIDCEKAYPDASPWPWSQPNP